MTNTTTDTTLKKILVVDDDQMMRIFIRDIFWIHGLNDKYAVSAVDGIEGAETMVSNPETRPDIIFMDLLMPTKEKDGNYSMKIDGSLNFVKKIKADDELKKIKVIVFSSFKERGIKDKLTECGADHYLVKGDFMPKEIIDFVESI